MRGLADPEIKAIVLGEVEQKTQMEDLVALIQAKPKSMVAHPPLLPM